MPRIESDSESSASASSEGAGDDLYDPDMYDGDEGLGNMPPMFWGCELSSENPCYYHNVDGLGEVPPMLLNIKQLALSPDAETGERNVIAVTVFNYNDAVDDLEEDMEDEEKEDIDEDAESNMNKTFVICTLTAGKVDQCSTDLLFSEVVEIRLLRGNGPVHLMGTTRPVGGIAALYPSDEEDSDFIADSDEEEDEDEEGEDEEDEEDEEESSSDEEVTVGSKRAASGSQASDSKRTRMGEPLTKAQIKTKKDEYRGSQAEKEELIANYERCAGHWDTILKVQTAATEEDLPRFKRIIEAAIRAKMTKKFTKAQQERALEKLKGDAPDEADLEDDEDDDEDDEEDDEERDSDRAFIDDEAEEDDEEDEDEEDEEEEESEEEEEEEEEEEPAKASQKTSKTPSKGNKSEKKGSDNKGTTPSLDERLKLLLKAPNTPKKQAKFANYAKHTLKMEDEKEIAALWEKFNATRK